MIIVDGKIVSDLLFTEQFSCQLDKCKGACCVQGDAGAPLEPEELATLQSILPTIWPRLSDEGQKAISKKGVSSPDPETGDPGTTLRENDNACAFVRIDHRGIAKCTIEEAWQDGDINFRKPLSCHLYPIRIERSGQGDFEVLKYEEWEICNPACVAGEALGIVVYEFAKEALIRKYGPAFYHALERADPRTEK